MTYVSLLKGREELIPDPPHSSTHRPGAVLNSVIRLNFQLLGAFKFQEKPKQPPPQKKKKFFYFLLNLTYFGAELNLV